jgi:predicted RNA-binding protein
MCQATVYLGDQKVAEEVIGLEAVSAGVRIAAFFEDPVVVRGRIRSIDFLKHRVLLEPLDEEPDDEGH